MSDDDFSGTQRLHDRTTGTKEPFVTRARHIHRYSRPSRVNTAKREAERDRMIFLWIMAALIAVGIVALIAAFIINKQNG